MKIYQDYIVMQELRKGSVSTFEMVYKIYCKKLFFFINSYTRNNETSEEILQDVFVKLWEKKESLDLSLSLNSYIYTIAKNLAIDFIRKKRVKIFPIENVEEKNISCDNEGEKHLISIELDMLLEDAIGRLSERKQKIFKLHRFDKLTYKQIAQQLGISVSAVEKNISLALKTIQKHIAQKK